MSTVPDHAKNAQGWGERVRTLLAGVDGPLPSLEQCAQRLCCSGRSLRRYLAREACSYQQLLDEERMLRAIKYLRARELPLSEVAFELGFSDQSNFRRAFKKWTGCLPTTYRH
jgi:AraC-like DNA-binding protein